MKLKKFQIKMYSQSLNSDSLPPPKKYFQNYIGFSCRILRVLVDDSFNITKRIFLCHATQSVDFFHGKKHTERDGELGQFCAPVLWPCSSCSRLLFLSPSSV